MDKIYLSDAGPKVSPAIYSFWKWEDNAETGTSVMEKIISYCLQSGINTFDLADIYGGYQCEALFGKVLNKKSFKREDVVLFTKAGLNIPHNSMPAIKVKYIDSSASHIIKTVENSLIKLQTDYIDIFLLNHLDAISNLEETALALEKLKSSGKVKNIGVANCSVFQHQLLAAFLRIPIVTNHIELNLLNTTSLDNGQVDYIKQRYMRPLAASPLASGRIENGTDELAVRVRSKLEEMAKKYSSNIESVAVAWLIKLGALPLIGTTSEKRISNIIAAFKIKLDNQDWYEIYQSSKQDLFNL